MQICLELRGAVRGWIRDEHRFDRALFPVTCSLTWWGIRPHTWGVVASAASPVWLCYWVCQSPGHTSACTAIAQRPGRDEYRSVNVSFLCTSWFVLSGETLDKIETLVFFVSVLIELTEWGIVREGGRGDVSVLSGLDALLHPGGNSC